MTIISEQEKLELPSPLNLELPEGWQYLNNEVYDYDKQPVSLEENSFLEDANNYFSGTRPNFPYIFANLVPRRKIVGELVNEINKYKDKKLRVIKLTAPGGEGKSTILRQIAVDLVRQRDSHIHVIFRSDEGASLSKTTFEYLLNLKDQKGKANYTFFIVADDAQTIALEIYNYVRWFEDFGKYRPSNKIRFLLAAKGTEWQWKKAPDKDKWSQIAGSDYHEVYVNRLGETDALEIAKAWKSADVDGIFSKETAGQLGARLFYVAKFSAERDRNSNSFYCAIFEVRKGKNLEKFIKDMLESFKQQPALDGKNLKDCYEYIVALHGDEKHLLTKQVLRRALGCYSLDQLEEKVIEPLADEKIEEGNLILARHDVFAQNVKHILEKTDPKFLNKIIPNLAVAAEDCFRATPKEVHKLENIAWLRLTREYFENSQTKELAIDIARAVAEKYPADPVHVGRLGQFLRKNDKPDKANLHEANNVFLNSFDSVNPDKGYFAEWGVVHGLLHNYFFDVLLTAIALSSNYGEEENLSKPWLMRLASLATAFSEAYDKSIKIGDDQSANTFRNATQGTIKLGDEKNAEKFGNNFRDYKEDGRNFPFEKSYPKLESALKKIKGNNVGIKKLGLEESFRFITDGINLAWKLCESEISKKDLPQKFPQKLEYSQLINAFGISLSNPEKVMILLNSEILLKLNSGKSKNETSSTADTDSQNRKKQIQTPYNPKKFPFYYDSDKEQFYEAERGLVRLTAPVLDVLKGFFVQDGEGFKSRLTFSEISFIRTRDNNLSDEEKKREANEFARQLRRQMKEEYGLDKTDAIIDSWRDNGYQLGKQWNLGKTKRYIDALKRDNKILVVNTK